MWDHPSPTSHPRPDHRCGDGCSCFDSRLPCRRGPVKGFCGRFEKVHEEFCPHANLTEEAQEPNLSAERLASGSSIRAPE